LAGRTLVHNARFGAWSKKAVIISLGSLLSRSGDYLLMSFFLHHFLENITVLKSKITRV
jgi:hypothetical protein